MYYIKLHTKLQAYSTTLTPPWETPSHHPLLPSTHTSPSKQLASQTLERFTARTADKSVNTRQLIPKTGCSFAWGVACYLHYICNHLHITSACQNVHKCFILSLFLFSKEDYAPTSCPDCLGKLLVEYSQLNCEEPHVPYWGDFKLWKSPKDLRT